MLWRKQPQPQPCLHAWQVAPRATSASNGGAAAATSKWDWKFIIQVALGFGVVVGITVYVSLMLNRAQEKATNANVLLAAGPDTLTIEEEVDYEADVRRLPHHDDPYFTTLSSLRKKQSVRQTT